MYLLLTSLFVLVVQCVFLREATIKIVSSLSILKYLKRKLSFPGHIKTLKLTKADTSLIKNVASLIITNVFTSAYIIGKDFND